MNTPIVLICGAAGSGKDTVAGFIQKYTSNTVAVAQADPMKRLARGVFNFTEEQLWGPSECRNAPEPRFDRVDSWVAAKFNLCELGAPWINEVLPHLSVEAQSVAWVKLLRWFDGLSVSCIGKDRRQLTPRTMLQTIGTEWGRDVDPDMWSRAALRTAKELLNGKDDYDRARGLVHNPQRGIPDLVLVTDGRFPNEVVNAASEGAHRLLVTNPAPSSAQAAVQAAGVAGHASEALLTQIPRHWYTAEIVNDKRQGLLALENAVHSYVSALKRTLVRYP